MGLRVRPVPGVRDACPRVGRVPGAAGMTYTVVSARHKKTVDGQHGPLQIIALILQDTNGPVDAEWATKPETPVPTEGQQLEGTLESGPYGLKFKRTPAASFGVGGGGGGWRDDPERERRIVRQHSEHMALQALALVF